MRGFLVIFAFCFSGAAKAGNFATCILDKMPGSQNQAFTGSVFNQCNSEHPGAYFAIKKGSERGFFGYKDGNACIQKMAKDTPHQIGSFAIANACRCLYNEPTFEGEMCAYRPASNPFSDFN